MIKTVLIARDSPISLKDFRAQLLVTEQTTEARLVPHFGMFVNPSSSSYASVKAMGSSNSGMGLLPTPSSLPVAYMGSYDHSVLPSLDRNSGSRPVLVVPECQICSKRGHTTANCYFRHEASSSKHGSQGQAPPSNLSAMTAQTSYVPDQVWIADNGASNHMVSDISSLNHVAPCESTEQVIVGNGEGLKIKHIGTTAIACASTSLKMPSVFHVPQLSVNLLFVHQLCKDNNCVISFDAFGFVIQDRVTKTILLKGRSNNGLYHIPSTVSSHYLSKKVALLGQHVKSSIWHHRLGHPTKEVVQSTLKASSLQCASDSSNSNPLCSACLQGKMHRLPFPVRHCRYEIPFHTVHSHVWGPSHYKSVEGYRYFVSFLDECTGYLWVYPLFNKSEVFSKFLQFHALIQNQFSAAIKCFQSDGGGEFLSKAFTDFLASKGIVHRLSCPYTPQQNGLAERKNRHIIETAITLLTTKALPSQFWFHSTAHAVYLINRMPNSVLHNQSPYFQLFGHHPHLASLRIFVVFPFKQINPGTCGQSSQFSPTASVAPVIISLPSRPYQASLNSQDPSSLASDTQVSTTQSQSISSTHGSLSPIQHQASLDDISVASAGSVPMLNEQQLQVMVPFEVSDASSSSVSLPVLPPLEHSSSGTSSSASLPISPINTHPMHTRLRDGIVQKKQFPDYVGYYTCLNAHIELDEPASYMVASFSPQWKQAMQEEIDALHMQSTWTLVPNPGNKNIVGSKWIYKIKRNSDGSIARHKARLVAQGFNQEQGLDFSETFSPVVRHTTARLILSLAAMNKWKLRQLDVKNAFLHGELEEEVFMKQPQGFADPHYLDFVCKLKKSLYGLKQAPRAWNAKFTGYLPAIGSDEKMVQLVIDELSSVFEMKDLGKFKFFLGLQVSYASNGDIFVNQAKYAKELLHKAGMQSCRSCSTPCKPHTQVLKDSGEVLTDPTLFRSIVGALQYLTFTRPDLAYSVNSVCQYMNQPTDLHWHLVKRILRYVQGTLEYGLSFTACDMHLSAHSDVDWAGDINTRRSTTGFVIFLGCNPISWQSKKQGSVSRSSIEAEYKALANTTADLAWIRQVLKDLKLYQPNPLVAYCDNLSTLALSSNPVDHSRIKHLDIDFHFVREQVQKKDLLVQYVSTDEQLTDVFTKGLHGPIFSQHCAHLRLRE
ncbi:unnamed protein product [Prunus armeniaca]